MNLTECEIRSVLLGLMVEWKSGTLQKYRIEKSSLIIRSVKRVSVFLFLNRRGF
jgi:hypothetical protein